MSGPTCQPDGPPPPSWFILHPALSPLHGSRLLFIKIHPTSSYVPSCFFSLSPAFCPPAPFLRNEVSRCFICIITWNCCQLNWFQPSKTFTFGKKGVYQAQWPISGRKEWLGWEWIMLHPIPWDLGRNPVTFVDAFPDLTLCCVVDPLCFLRSVGNVHHDCRYLHGALCMIIGWDEMPNWVENEFFFLFDPWKTFQFVT